MSANDRVRRIPPSDRTSGELTAGMIREEAVSVDGLWAGLARTEPGMVSGWHHHGEYETVIYVLSGQLRMESGPGGTDIVEAEPGDFLYVPAGAIHREGNPGTEESQLIAARAGHGPAVVNVEGPAAS